MISLGKPVIRPWGIRFDSALATCRSTEAKIVLLRSPGQGQPDSDSEYDVTI
ncbi:hypothetical protein SS50377_20489 [Spironucleus salmonicida]|uniref:Uncharacterized protein n=1 Tax=Spironucleus salmonicida TaxID=348837 RepID=A0A9P8M032_9EUKA|nr:hypothetical protein SS50377_20480 [Spironucleus salmonicida]KAH0577138.1 hypothetical protein SS50377_20489 [Spironucleus salmonicida]